MLVDQDNHFHEDQPPGNLIYWSRDGGDAWEGPLETGIMGFEPDQITELPDGRLAITSHLIRGDSQMFAVILSCSDDGGKTWYEEAEIAHDGRQYFCEGALLTLADGGLACVMRDNTNNGYPSRVAFSEDGGRNWSAPQMLPFAFHRPYAKQLPDGRTLVTGRNVNGGVGTYAWCGDLRAETGYQIGGPRYHFCAGLDAEAFVIHNKPDTECRYCLLPPESYKSEAIFEATVRVEGAPGTPVAFLAIARIGAAVFISADGVGLNENGTPHLNGRVDMTQWRHVRLSHRRGLAEVAVDGKTLLYHKEGIKEEGPRGSWANVGPLNARSHFGQFGTEGKSCWRDVRYEVKNQTRPDVQWSWSAESGWWPDDYQRRRLVQIHVNVPGGIPWTDHGYSSWVELPDGHIFSVDYTNYGDAPDTSHLVGVHMDSHDIA